MILGAFYPLICMLTLGHFTAGKALGDSQVEYTVKSTFIGVCGWLRHESLSP